MQATGSVRFLQQDAIAQQLEQGHIVLLTSLAYSASGAIFALDVGWRTLAVKHGSSQSHDMMVAGTWRDIQGAIRVWIWGLRA